MRKFVLAFIVSFSLSSAAIAAFAIFQTALETVEPAVTTCDINTGIATGLDAGTCASPVAVCDGVTNNFAAFTSFNTWAKATATQAAGGLIELRVTGNCAFTSGGNAKTFVGLTKARLWGYGATFTSDNNQPSLGTAGDVTPAGICHKGIADAGGCSARLVSVSAGATAVTLLDTALCSRFTTGRWAVVTGFDIQGNFTSFGYPPNPNFLDYVQIGSTTNCATTGQIAISRPLTNSYLSTWPNFASGTGGEADQGGPATIYALDSTWGGEVDIRGVSVVSANQAFYISRSVTLRDVTMSGNNCIIPTQSDTFTMINSTGTSCAIEVDKMINTLTYSGTTLRRLMFQSSSINTLNFTNGTLTQDLNGTPKVANIVGLTTPSMRIGPYAYGPATSVSCTNCAITNPITSVGVSEDGFTAGANNFFTVSSGVFSYPVSQSITNLVDNGAGKSRLSVANAAGWKVGAGIGLSGQGACTPPCTGGSTIIAVDTIGNTIDININFAEITWSGGGTVYNSAEQERWAVPGTNVFATCQWAACIPAFQVNSVTQSGGFVNIATTLPGSYPTVPLPGTGKSNLQVQMPRFTCTNCTGNVQMTQDFARAPPNIPIFSYSNRDFDNNTALTSWNVWGKVTSIKINVTTAYAGAAVPGTFRVNLVEETVVPAGTTSFWSGLINLKQVGLRTITPAGVTCDTGGGPVAGACSGDSGLTLPDPAAMFAGTLEQQMPNGTPVDSPWAMNAEFIMDQGVVP